MSHSDAGAGPSSFSFRPDVHVSDDVSKKRYQEEVPPGSSLYHSSSFASPLGSVKQTVAPRRTTATRLLSNVTKRDQAESLNSLGHQGFRGRLGVGYRNPMRKAVDSKMLGLKKPGDPPKRLTAGQKAVRSRLSSSTDGPDVSDCRKIRLLNVPDEYNKPDFLRSKFSFYKNLVRVVSNTKTKTAVLEFDSHLAAKLAKTKGTILFPGTRSVRINWVLSPSQQPATTSRSRLTQSEVNSLRGETAQLPLKKQQPFVSDIASRFASANKRNDMHRTIGRPQNETHGEVPDRNHNFGFLLKGNDTKKMSSASSAPNLFSSFSFKENLEAAKKAAALPIVAPKPVSRRSIDLDDIKRQARALIGVEARTAAEKYQLLENRDKLLRLARRHKRGLQSPCCPDMCSEKERYQREYQMQVGCYEGDNGKIDHARAVKDYARSSADQEQPLGHELRPGPVLLKTMEYLLGNIVKDDAPTADSELGLWYDFLWSRTRAIRKDLTQQKLISKVAVKLFEISARFHIFSAHWLCELDMQEFDQKINTENMTKCLQSLRHLYEDLAKKSIACESEAEFRSYEVLASLDDPYVFRQALSWSDNVRNSKEVRTALKLLVAMQTNNYVQFFRVLQNECSYLQCCLTYRYFEKVRANAIQTMVRSYQANSQFAVYDLLNVLAFETPIDCVEFCQRHGLSSDPLDGQYVLLNRSQFASTEAPMIKRSNRIIEAKRCRPLSEILNDGPLDPSFGYQPVNSFDAFDRYVKDPVLASFLEQEFTLESPVEPQRSKEEQERIDFMNLQKEISWRTLTQVTTEVISQECAKVAVDAVAVLYRDHFTDQFVQETIREIFSAEAHSFLSMAKDAENFLRRLSMTTLENLLHDVIGRECSKIARERLKSELIRHLTDVEGIVVNGIWESTIMSEIGNIAQTVFQSDVVEVLRTLSCIRQRLELAKWRRYARFWRKRARKAKEHREIFTNFPVRPFALEDSESVARLYGLKRSRSLVAGSNAESPQEMLEQVKRHRRSLEQLQRERSQRLDFVRVYEQAVADLTPAWTGRQFRLENTRLNYVQILVLFDQNVEPQFKDWIQAKFGTTDGTATCVVQNVLDPRCSLIVCAKTVSVNVFETDENSLAEDIGKSDICFIASGSKVEEHFLDLATQCILKSNAKVMLVLLACAQASMDAFAEQLESLGCLQGCFELCVAQESRISHHDCEQLELCLTEVISCLSRKEFILTSLPTFASEVLLEFIVAPLASLSDQPQLDKAGVLREISHVLGQIDRFSKVSVQPSMVLDSCASERFLPCSDGEFLTKTKPMHQHILDPWKSVIQKYNAMNCSTTLDHADLGSLLDGLSCVLFTVPQSIFLCFDSADLDIFHSIEVDNCLSSRRVTDSNDESGPQLSRFESGILDSEEWSLLKRVESEIALEKYRIEEDTRRYEQLLADAEMDEY